MDVKKLKYIDPKFIPQRSFDQAEENHVSFLTLAPI